ncbi:cation diffusion facilitator family transporter [Marinobacterium sedimentorum]|uniref:cation diffusion facilitator family transporter n=1 Tax=Marinobacterium sedimentorum TaxID=2927804 RepID=UPI0020C667C9|nr:cation diffusion facilitator family transporter [Marinobacterium sedimentorum]MCP8690001.1 cation diffusion facilitator family transporter [Marinobacterium sedimentorum]
MGTHCCEPQENAGLKSVAYRRVLWIALLLNLAMFGVEIVAGMRAGSVSLLADSLDFLGDSANYGISLWVLGLGLAIRARASLFKAFSMAAFGVGILGTALWHLYSGTLPDAPTMGVIGALALITNLAVAWLLWAYREGDSNMRSVWLCTRNDAIGNVAVLLAALGVFGTQTAWPDLAVGTLMALLALSSAWQVTHRAWQELKQAAPETQA